MQSFDFLPRGKWALCTIEVGHDARKRDGLRRGHHVVSNVTSVFQWFTADARGKAVLVVWIAVHQ